MDINLQPSKEPIKVEIIKGAKEKDDAAEKLFTTFGTIVVTAIFYYTGWTYVSHWYSFYGIDATALNIPIQVILLHGVPGLVLILISGLIPLTFFSIINFFFPNEFASLKNNWPWIIVLTYPIVLYSTGKLSDELMSNGVLVPTAESNIMSEGGLAMAIVSAIPLIWYLLTLKFHSTPSETFPFPLPMQIFAYLFYFFTAVYASILLGTFDAARAARFVVGDWHIPVVSLHSTVRIPFLTQYETKDGEPYTYSRLGLLGSSDKYYYLVNLKGGKYYRVQPKVYIIPFSDHITVELVASENLVPLPREGVITEPTLTPLPP